MSVAIGSRLRAATFALGLTVVFGLLMLASLWFAIPFGFALALAAFAWVTIALRIKHVFGRLRSWSAQLR
ncbi:MAG TPA: hypothetical protein VF091_05770 [Gaiellaceae bacterium]